MSTKFDELNAIGANAKIVTALPTAPYQYYGAGVSDVASIDWRGGELAFMKIGSDYQGMLYIQLASSGATAIWSRLKETLATSTSTSSSTTTTSSSSTTTTGAP